MPEPETYITELTSLFSENEYVLSNLFLTSKRNRHDEADLPEHNYFSVQDNKPLDVLVVTGAPVEKLPFDQVSYWEEISTIVKHAQEQGTHILGICWGAMLIAKLHGLEKSVRNTKLFGVYPFKNVARDIPIMEGMENEFHWPVSTYAVLDLQKTRSFLQDGAWIGLGENPDVGVGLLCSKDYQILLSLAHPEYSPNRLIREYERDKRQGLYTAFPSGISHTFPSKFLKPNSALVISNWLHQIQLKTRISLL